MAAESQPKSSSPAADNDNDNVVPGTSQAAQSSTTQPIQGYAVLHIRSKNKVEAIRKALYKSKLLLDGLTFDPEVDIPEEMLSLSAVNQQLLAEQANESQANAALESFLLDKLYGGTSDLTQTALMAFTEIFHCCFVTEQRMSMVERSESYGYICLARDQIMLNSPANLMHTFLNAVRPAKKTLTDQTTFILKKYGIPKQVDKEE